MANDGLPGSRIAIMPDPARRPSAQREALLDAALKTVAFDGWSEACFRSAARDAGMSLESARACCPRGALDLAVDFHRRGDDAMAERLETEDIDAMRYRDRVATAVRRRLEAVEDKEAARRSCALFALPQNAPEGARLIWGTADRIWASLGDDSADFNWYSKRATLSCVYAAAALYWLGDESPDRRDTWAFLDRRVEDVMRIGKVRAEIEKVPLLKRALVGPERLLSRIRPPSAARRRDLPGFLSEGE